MQCEPIVSDVAALIEIFTRTRYRVLSGRETWVLRVGAHAPEPDACWPHAVRFAVITACNPGGKPSSVAANCHGQRQLVALIESAGLQRMPTLAAATDGSFAEPGWLVCDAQLSWLDDVARSFGQLAVLEWQRAKAIRLRCYGEFSGLPDALAAYADFVD